MIGHKSFSELKILATPGGILKGWQKAREEARWFISSELNDEDVIGITETSVDNPVNLLTVAVWHRNE